MLWIAIGALILAIPFGYLISRLQPAWGHPIEPSNCWLAAAIALEMTGAFVYALVHAV